MREGRTIGFDLVLRGGTVLAGARVRAGDIGISDGRIAALGPSLRRADRVVDVSGSVVLPGLVDGHVHFGVGAGLAEWRTESRAAAAGGVTTVLSYLMSKRGYGAVLRDEVAAAERESLVDFGLHFVPMTARHLGEVERYVSRLGMPSGKVFTSFKGADARAQHIRPIGDDYLYRFLRQMRESGGVACVHPESIELHWALLAEAGPPADAAAWDAVRPAAIEADAIEHIARIAALVHCPIYLVHVSSADALDAIRVARRRWPDLPIHAETCPHYLTHTTDTPFDPPGVGKALPPLRSARDADALWEGIASGEIDVVASDHVAKPLAGKAGAFAKATAGFPNVGMTLPALVTHGVIERGIGWDRIASVTSTAPATIFGLRPTKGAIDVGADADLVVVDPDARRAVDGRDAQRTVAGYSLYAGHEFSGWPRMTILRGETIFENDEPTAAAARGRFIARPPAGR